MKKLLFILTSLFVLSIGMVACDKEEEDEGAKMYSSKEGRIINISETEFVRMYYSPQTGDVNSPAEFIFENHTEGVLIYGSAFSLEYFENNNWTKIPLDINFELVGLSLNAGETDKSSFNPLSFIKTFNKGKKGKYRHILNMQLTYDFPFGDMDKLTVYVEFEIE